MPAILLDVGGKIKITFLNGEGVTFLGRERTPFRSGAMERYGERSLHRHLYSDTHLFKCHCEEARSTVAASHIVE
ncbi:MAG: hypothetical protein HZB51_32235 [Chloroflexi bacterium]|nr:hypothetical protein [Chloroflexota bacterium]